MDGMPLWPSHKHVCPNQEEMMHAAHVEVSPVGSGPADLVDSTAGSARILHDSEQGSCRRRG